MPLPKQVKEAADKANELLAQQGNTVASDDAAPAIDPPVTTPPPVEPPPAPEVPPSAPNWEQRYYVLEGKYRAEVPRLAEQVRRLEAALEEAQKQKPVATTPDPELADLTQEEIERFGPEFHTFVKKASRGEMAQALIGMQKRLDTIENNMKATTQQVAESAEERYHAALLSLVPDWRQVNASAEWLEWLGETDPLTNKTRQVLLDAADAAMDANRVANFFIAFRGNGAGAYAPRQQNTPPIAPPVGRGGNPPPTVDSQQQGRMWTGTEITRFYDEKRRGLWRGRDDEALRIEKDIIAAQQEGRITR